MHTTQEAPVAEPRSVPDSIRANQLAVAGRDRRPFVEVRAVRHSFGELRVIDRLDLAVRDGEVVGIVGPSGCGKSTLLELIAGLREPTGGEIAVEGEREAGRRLARSAYMPQRDVLLPWLRAIDNAALALRNRGVPRRAARRAAAPLFERFGLAGFELARPGELSGGMRQRVAFLRTLLAGKDVLLLDEPFGALDSITRAQMQEWLLEALGHEPRTVVLVTHDVEEALLVADRVAVLSARPGRIVAELDVDVRREGPRRAIVTDPDFVVLREQVLEALE